jgi:hypothetical protein
MERAEKREARRPEEQRRETLLCKTCSRFLGRGRHLAGACGSPRFFTAFSSLVSLRVRVCSFSFRRETP